MTVDFVFPEDSGTGAAGGDSASAANFATFAYHLNLIDYVAVGLTVTPDYTVPDFDLNAGLCFLSDASAQEAKTNEARDQGVAYVAQVAGRTGVALTDNAVNEVFIDVDLTSDDTISVTATTGGTTPSQPYLKIAEVDTSADTKTPFNRNHYIQDRAQKHNYNEVSSNATLGHEGYYKVNSDGGARTVTLASAYAVSGREVNIKREGSNDVTINTEGSETIDGSSSITLTQNQEAVTLVYNANDSDWEVW